MLRRRPSGARRAYKTGSKRAPGKAVYPHPPPRSASSPTRQKIIPDSDAKAMANPSTSAEAAASCRATKLTCLCSPTNHPGSFRCSRHRSPRARAPSSLSPSGRASHQAMASGIKSGGGVAAGGASRTASKGRSITLRVHLQRLVSHPSSDGGDHRRSRDFEPRLSRLGRLAVNA
uniref:Uncharacterized protein n=1 Tax=Avena sativa TaxID=4498 RepID=A0ACD5ZEI7_AVESA